MPGLSAEENKKWTESAARTSTGIFLLAFGATKLCEVSEELSKRLLLGAPWILVGLSQLFLFREKPIPIRQPQFWTGVAFMLSFFGFLSIPKAPALELGTVLVALSLLFVLFSIGLGFQAQASRREVEIESANLEIESSTL